MYPVTYPGDQRDGAIGRTEQMSGVFVRAYAYSYDPATDTTVLYYKEVGNG